MANRTASLYIRIATSEGKNPFQRSNIPAMRTTGRR
jgi:hypothetical protein